MSSTITIGTAQSQPGQIVYGKFDAVKLPTGGSDFFPIIIAQGREAGPTFWVTGNIHGDEYNGLAVIHQLITSTLVDRLKGTLVALPTLNPAGLRVDSRTPYYSYGKDPNRQFPPMQIADDDADAVPPPSGIEMAFARLFERIDATADYLVDLHDYGIRSIPFAFRDPIFYREARDKAVARKLLATVGEMLDALGITVVNEYGSAQYLDMNLHRSVSGATLNRARIPAITIEIGGQGTANQRHVTAICAGIRNVLRWAGMLEGKREPLGDIPVINLDYPMRRTTHPRVPEACIVHYLVEPGDIVQAGDAVARMVDIYGRPVGADNGLLRTEHDGFVIGIFPGMVCYPNDAIMGLAIRDDNDMIVLVRDRH